MVLFEYNKQEEDDIYFWYYVEDKSKQAGTIIANLEKDEINVVELAEGDFEYDIPVEEINEIVNATNAMKYENGETDFTEKATEPIHVIEYGDHAISEICRYLIDGYNSEHKRNRRDRY